MFVRSKRDSRVFIGTGRCFFFIVFVFFGERRSRVIF